MGDRNFLTSGDAAKRLGVSHTRVLQFCDQGLLHPVRTVGGIRLFSQDEVDRLILRRQKAQEPAEEVVS
jgi:excisionase family DNA binding protein